MANRSMFPASRALRIAAVVTLIAGLVVVSGLAPPASSVETWETQKISTYHPPSKDIGETTVVADDAGRVSAVWMATATAELRTRRSTDGGTTWVGSDTQVVNKAADPVADMHTDGDIYLVTIEGNNIFLSPNNVKMRRSTNFGSTYPLSGTVEAANTNDRPGLFVDSNEQIHVAYRVYGIAPHWNVYYERSTDQGVNFGSKVEVTATKPSGAIGCLSNRVGKATDGRIVVGCKAVPDGGTYESSSHLYVYSSTNNGATFGTPIQYTTASTMTVDASTTPIGFKPFGGNVLVSGNNVYAIWIGNAAGGTHSVYSAVWRAGQSGFDTPVAIKNGPALSLTLPTITVGPTGKIHAFWLGKRADTKFTNFYASSTDAGATYTTPVEPSTVTFDNLNTWIGDYNLATTNSTDVFFTWGVSGTNKGTWITILRDGA